MKTTTDQFTNIKSSGWLLLFRVALSMMTSILVSSCAVAPPTVLRETVGPRAAATAVERNGFLQVYSRSIWTTADDLETSLLSYTDYDINAADSSLVKRVVNGEEEPERVALPVGRYTVVAQSETEGTISVPVAIETGATTVVRLDQDAKKAFAGLASADLVRLPNGQAIGFRSKDAASLGTPAMMAAQSKITGSTSKQSKG